ncbi:head-tail connector protein [Cognatishimia sp.]|uniref:head-tail connector protein n=1 Tax=Cognatishimia sp. TaxID=2211648 RepID=UPI003513074E
MNLVETGSVAVADLPLAALRAHLRLGTGFGDETLQDAVLEGYLRAALAAVEARISKVLIARGFELTVAEWSDARVQVLPRAPVSSVTHVALRDLTGAETVVQAARYRLEFDQHAPKLRAVGALLPNIGSGEAIVAFTAGFGGWADVPADLQQAVMLLAAHYYEYRNETALARGCMPFGVTSLIERFRPMRIGARAV